MCVCPSTYLLLEGRKENLPCLYFADGLRVWLHTHALCARRQRARAPLLYTKRCLCMVLPRAYNACCCVDGTWHGKGGHSPCLCNHLPYLRRALPWKFCSPIPTSQFSAWWYACGGGVMHAALCVFYISPFLRTGLDLSLCDILPILLLMTALQR